MTDLADFLRARYAERRTIAEAASPWPWKINPDDPEEVLAGDGILVADVFALSSNQTRNTATFIATNDPAHVIADLDAKLAIIDLLAPIVADESYQGPDHYGGVDACEKALSLLARPFAGHVDYQENWTA
jgi:hypothetical protein